MEVACLVALPRERDYFLRCPILPLLRLRCEERERRPHTVRDLRLFGWERGKSRRPANGAVFANGSGRIVGLSETGRGWVHVPPQIRFYWSRYL